MNAQKIIWGLNGLGKELQEAGCRRILLVADSSFPYLSIKDIVLQEACPAVQFDAFHSNPSYDEICAGVELFRDGAFDALLAVGGGSAMDVAKCIKLAEMAIDGPSCLIPPLVGKQAAIKGRPMIPLFAIPTTAGTGAESTGNAVHYFNGVKQTVTHPCIRPDVAFLEPTVLETLPLYQKKCTMMDALCQGIESWWSVEATPESREYSRMAVETLISYWRRYIFDYDSVVAEKIMLAANYAGQAIHIAHTTAAHAMSYKLGSIYSLPHGHAVAVCLPEIWDYMISCASDQTQVVFADIAAAMGAENPSAAVRLFRSMMAEMGLERPEGGAQRESTLETLATCVNPTRMRNNPVALDTLTCKMLYDRIIH